MQRFALTVALLLWPVATMAQALPSGDLTVAKIAGSTGSAPLRVTTTGMLIDCAWKPGQVVMQLGSEGGTGGAVTYSLAAPSGGTLSGDLLIGGAPPACAAANSCLVIGPTGVAPANCGKLENVVVNAVQQAVSRFGWPTAPMAWPTAPMAPLKSAPPQQRSPIMPPRPGR